MSGITVNKAAQGFEPAGARPACRNCAQVRQQPPNQPGFNGPSWYCGQGGFYTSAMAVCRQHKRTGTSPALPATVKSTGPST